MSKSGAGQHTQTTKVTSNNGKYRSSARKRKPHRLELAPFSYSTAQTYMQMAKQKTSGEVFSSKEEFRRQRRAKSSNGSPRKGSIALRTGSH